MKTHKNKAMANEELREAKKAKENLIVYQRLCEKRIAFEKEAAHYCQLMRQDRGKWQEALRKKNEADKEMLEFHTGLMESK